MGQGSVKKRGKTWTLHLGTVDPATGKRKQLSKGGFRTKKDALEALDNSRGSLRHGAYRPPNKTTVDGLVETVRLPARRSEGLRPTSGGPADSLRRHPVWCLQSRPFSPRL
jgi:hypothetical protein